MKEKHTQAKLAGKGSDRKVTLISTLKGGKNLKCGKEIKGFSEERKT